MATLSVQSVSRSGLNASFASAAAGGDQFTWGARRFIHIKNGDASSHTLTVASQYASDPQGLTSADLTVSIPAGEERMVGPFSERAFADSDGNVQLSYDAVTSVTVAVLEVP